MGGAYVPKKETGDLKMIIIATGSEVEHAAYAADELGDGVRVVSMPCMERFDRQDASYQESVLPKACTKRMAVEAGITTMWCKVIGVDRYGFSAPGDITMKVLGMTGENVLKEAK